MNIYDLAYMKANLRKLKRTSIHTLYRFFPNLILSNEAYSYYLFRNTPLHCSDNNLILFWSAKSGCSFVSKWLFFQCGVLDKAMNYNSWIHRYRMEVFQNQKNYIPNLSKALFDKNSITIKVIRNPYARAVSSYLTFNTYYKNNRNFDRFHQTERPRIFEYLNRSEQDNFSFEEFIDFLWDVEQIDTHFIKQTHQLEKTGVFKFSHILKLETLNIEILKIEKLYGLKSSREKDFMQSSHHVNYINTSNDFCGDRKFNFNRGDDIKIPPYQNFYNPSLQEKVYQLYKEDFFNYNYPKAL